MRPKVLDWKADYIEAMGRFKTVDPFVQRLLADTAAEIDATSKRSDKALTEGSVATAYGHIQEATAGANALAIGARAIEVLLQTEDFDAASNVVTQSGGASRTQAMVERLKAYQPNSPEDAILAISAWSDVLTAVSLDSAVNRELQVAKQATDAGRALHPPVPGRGDAVDREICRQSGRRYAVVQLRQGRSAAARKWTRKRSTAGAGCSNARRRPT